MAVDSERHILSKSTFLRGMQCEKSLYLYKNNYALKDPIPPATQLLFNRGHKVGELAQQLFPCGVDSSPSSRYKYRDAVAKTAALINEGVEIIYEACFQHDQVLVILDILVKKDGQWYGYEVKSSAKITPVYVMDAAVQYHVITQYGIDLKDISLITLNRDYQLQDTLALNKLFKITSVFDKVQEYQDTFKDKIAEFKALIFNNEIPNVAIGNQCSSPYDCDFKGYCWKDVPNYSVLDLINGGREVLFELYHDGVKNILDIPESYPLSKEQQIQVQVLKEGSSYVDKTATVTLLEKVNYPVFFTDFEVLSMAVPLFKGTGPFEPIPFQYSLHKKEDSNADLVHQEFIAEVGIDPRESFLTQFLKTTEGEGSIVIYDYQLERLVLKKLKAIFPEFKSEIDNRLARMVDVFPLFKAQKVYFPELKKSNSLLEVAKAMGYDYTPNEEVMNGRVAAFLFENLQTETDIFKLAETRENLLAYCKNDTAALAHIFEWLSKERLEITG